jgi:hypothetical protein
VELDLFAEDYFGVQTRGHQGWRFSDIPFLSPNFAEPAGAVLSVIKGADKLLIDVEFGKYGSIVSPGMASREFGSHQPVVCITQRGL